MSNSINSQNQTLELQQVPEQNPNQHDQAARQWETMVRGWISMLPEGKTVTSSEVEAWINSNLSFLPDEFKSMPRPELYEWFNSIANSMKASNEVRVWCIQALYFRCLFCRCFLVVFRLQVPFRSAYIFLIHLVGENAWFQKIWRKGKQKITKHPFFFFTGH